VNQLLATGGLLFFLQSFATFLWTTDHRSVRPDAAALEILDMPISGRAAHRLRCWRSRPCWASTCS
jgi:hypothetical protein